MKLPKSEMDRRKFLAASGAGLGLFVARGESVEAIERGSPSPKDSKANYGSVEALLDIEYTGEEWEQLLVDYEKQLDHVRVLRKLRHPNALAPAQTFDPRLPGVTYDLKETGVALGARPGMLPSDSEDIAFAPATHLAHWIRTGQISSLELTRLYLDRIRGYDAKLQCFITITEALAIEQAKEADAEIASGQYRGPLHGLPYGLKDLFATKGIRTTWGAAPYKENVPNEDAHIVTKLREAGAVLLGKTSSGAIAYGDVWFGGVTRNPWDTREGSRGSSAGSAAATVAGLVAFSIGTETLGSIVAPSTRCGATGLRPTFGRVGRTGGMALCWSLDKVGAICRSVEDTALVLEAINGFDAKDASTIDTEFSYNADADLTKITVGYDPKYFGEDAEFSTLRKALEALRSLGVGLKEIELPQANPSPLILELFAESAAAFEALTLSGRDDELRRQSDSSYPNTWRKARFISAIDYIQADRLRRTFMLEMDDLFQGIDVLIGDNFAGNLMFITNYTGHPQLTVPCGFQSRKVVPAYEETSVADGELGVFPASIGLWSGLFGESKLLRVGRALEQVLSKDARRPKL